MNTIMGLINLQEDGSLIRELADRRAVESIPFAGRYRLIDFALSSMVNSGIHKVGVMLPDEPRSVLDHLRSVGVRVYVGHDASHVDPTAVVVVSTAIRESNPELAIARERGQRVIHRSQALALAASGMRFVGVAGAHGKTSTSGMLAIALAACGLDPSVAVGGVLPQLGTGAHLGAGDVFVAEADESDGSFLNYSPSIEIVTNVEPDHLDRYHSREEFEQIFVEFARRMVPGGLLVTCAEDEGAVRLASAARAEGLRVVTYGRAGRALHTPDVVISDVRVEARGASASLAWGDRSAELVMGVPGEHNVLNAAGAWVAGIECGLDPQAVADGLGQFTGAARRFEARGQVGTRRLFDDYAHHPTEVEAAIREARVVADGGGHGCLPAASLLAHAYFCGAFRRRTVRRRPRCTRGDLWCPRGSGTRRRFDVDLLSRARCCLR